MKPGTFLTAEWRHLVLMNYEVEPCLLEPHVPAGVELDFWHDKTYVSLVGFIFRRARICRLAIPFHSSFPEVNLRFYVKRTLPDGERRGVVFLNEIVPRRIVALVARSIYGEKFIALPLSAEVDFDERAKDIARRVRFEWRLKDRRFAMEATATAPPQYPEPGSLEEFVIEHYWAYSVGRNHGNGCTEYEVEHPRWLIRPAARAVFIGDAAALYGAEFGETLSRRPDSAFLADGSAVAVRRGNCMVGSSEGIHVHRGWESSSCDPFAAALSERYR